MIKNNGNEKRTTKEYKVDDTVNSMIKSKYGTLDKNNPEILYIRSRATITPEIRKKDFSEDIAYIKKVFEKNVKSIIINSRCFEKKYICSIDMSENGISYGKKSHLKYDVFIKPKENKPLKDYSPDIHHIVELFNTNLSQLLSNKNITIS